MKKTIILIAAAVAALQARAQEPQSDLNRQMDVTREYEPTVNEARKLDVKPNMVDTVALRPEFSYGIHPSPIGYGFEVTPIRPVSVNLDNFRQLTPLYVRAGLGVPFQSVLDAYIATTGKTNGKWGGYVNHYGSWSDIKNVNGLKTPAAQTFNSAGVFGEHRFGRFGIGGEIGYDYDKVSRYGYDRDLLISPDRFDASSAALRQNFSTVRGRLDFGHSFEDLSRFNVRFGVEGAYFQDHFDMKETDVKAYLELGKRFGRLHEVTLRAGYDYYKGSGGLADYKDNVISVRPMYRLRGGKAEFALGANIVFDDNGEDNETSFFPLLEFTWRAAKGFTPYLKVDGQYVNNGYRATAARNPYVLQGAYGANTSEYNGRIGIRGSSRSSFSYDVFGGYSGYRNMNFFTNFVYAPESDAGALPGNVFVPLGEDVWMWTLGGELEGRISGSFGIEFGMQYRWYKEAGDLYDMDNGEPMGAVYRGLPDLTGRIALKYSYRDKLVVRAGVDVCGPRDFTVLGMAVNGFGEQALFYGKNHVDMQYDVHLGAEYNISKKIGVFVEGRNLANQKLFRYNLYPSLGVNFLAGVKLQF